MHALKQVLCSLILVHACIVRLSSFPYNAANDDIEIITVEEITRSTIETKNPQTHTLLITENIENNSSIQSSESTSSAQNDASNEPMIDIADDLIFLVGSVPSRLHQHQHQNQNQHRQAITIVQTTPQSTGIAQQTDLLASVEKDSLTSTLSTLTGDQNVLKSTTDSGNNDDGGSTNMPTIINERAHTASTTVANVIAADNGIVSNIDESGSSLTPPQIELRMRHVNADKTKDNDDSDDDDDDDDDDFTDADAIVDTETTVDDNDSNDDDDDGGNDGNVTISEELDVPSVETPITPIDMSDFVALIPSVAVKSIASNYYHNDPEVQRAYAYLNSRDFMILRQHIIELPEVKTFLRYLNSSGLDVVGFMNTLTNLTRKADEILNEESMEDVGSGSGSDIILGNEIENDLQRMQVSPTSTIQTETETTTEEQLNGLHGLVDSILGILPQDQILATFFDKLETNQQFSNLVENIGRPAFAKILHNLQNSPQLRVLVFNLHNNGIYITRIVESMKAYFFLGAF